MLDQILSLPLEKKIGQLFFIGLRGPDITSDDRRLLEETSPGGVCLFARNVREAEQTRRLLDDIRLSLPIEPFLSLDQEGGLVDRLRRVCEPMPAAETIKTAEDAARLARLTGETVRLLGFNMNFAPVVDVVTEPRRKTPNGLFTRTFGRSREEVARFAAAYFEALREAGCLGCLKHFPGLGATEVDSHEELPQVTLEEDEIDSVDLFPYREILRASDVAVVMAGHAAFPRHALQERDRFGKLTPSSLSYNFITRLLRENLGFRRLVVTDDLEMGAILKNYGIGEACKMALRAGVDQLLICNREDTIRAGFEAVVEAVRAGELDEALIDNSLQRTALVKNLIKPPLPFDKNRLAELSTEISRLKEHLI